MSFAFKKKMIQDRIIALKNLQLEQLKLTTQFYEEVNELEKKYQNAFQPIYDSRAMIINGVVDPPKEEPKYPVAAVEHDGRNEKDFSKMLKDVKAIPADVKGVPNFWLTVLKNTKLLADKIKPYDEPVLKELRDVKIVYEENNSFIIEFYFGENNYFNNTKLSKKYFMRNYLDEFESPIEYDGPEYINCTGCHIDWNPNKNLTVKTITRKQKRRPSGVIRKVFKQIPNDTFFNFFNPPTRAQPGEVEDPDTESLLATDFQIGEKLRLEIIPSAILYFTGDLIDDDDDDGEWCDCDEESTDESDESGAQQPGAFNLPEYYKHQ